MRYRLRTLLILLAVMPPLLAGGYWAVGKYRERYERMRQERAMQEEMQALEAIANQMGGGLRSMSREESARIKAMLESPAD